MTDGIPALKEMSFDDKYALFESLNTMYPHIRHILEGIRFLDYEKILSHPEMTQHEVYTKGFTALPRLIEELALEIKNNNSKK